MSVTAPPEPQKPSILAAFQTAPMLVKVLASVLYGVGLLTLIQMASFVADWRLIGPNDHVAAVVSGLPGLVVALLLLLLGRGITRGAYGSWLATLIFAVLLIVQRVLWILPTVTGSWTRTVLMVGVALAVLALLLTPAVRQHCPKR
ncbi:MAG: hypothetical protein ABI474_05135 [Actinomycetota bacterium]